MIDFLNIVYNKLIINHIDVGQSRNGSTSRDHRLFVRHDCEDKFKESNPKINFCLVHQDLSQTELKTCIFVEQNK